MFDLINLSVFSSVRSERERILILVRASITHKKEHQKLRVLMCIVIKK